jgi:hypothetical protein
VDIEIVPDVIKSVPVSRPSMIIISNDIETDDDPVIDDKTLNLVFTDFEKEPLPPIRLQGHGN